MNEVRNPKKAQHEQEKQILTEDREKPDQPARQLHEKETIAGEEFIKILEG